MGLTLSLLLVGALALVAYALSGNMPAVFGIWVPYAASTLFLVGMVYRVIDWARSPVPFRITTTCGQAKSLPWIRSEPLESPSGLISVLGRMFLEVLFFRSLFRNSKADVHGGPKLVYGSSKWLWIFAMLFHWSFLVTFIRHLRFFTEPVPFLVTLAHSLDGIFEIGVPALYITNALILLALSCLLVRRIIVPHLRYISLLTDYLPLIMLFGIVLSGVIMRYFVKTDVVAAKKLIMSLLVFSPAIPDGLGAAFYIHLFLVCVFFALFPVTKLSHMAGVFLSPTRNLANTNRVKRHINPWNAPVKVHTYEEWEDEFSDRLKAAGYQLERD
ncbi:MAG TPA: sulfate reduction electron transfer complex DsrMKJOP subunit DsrM [Spirochaetota bacterium]|nr:sulfate reduction electron transfer complex DsrMKJOP subunit DsrM [Spirochaetota bacterium]